MNYFELYPGDYLRDTRDLTMLQHGAFLLLMVAYYGKEEPFPNKNSALFRVTAAMNSAERQATLEVANRYFPVGVDGLRHNARADAEIAKAQVRMEGADDRRANDAKRKQRSRERRAAMFEQLRGVGIVPEFDISAADLSDLVTRHVTVTVTPNVTRDGTATRPQTPDPNTKAFTPASTPDTPPRAASPTEAGRACLLMREAGCARTNPNHPDLLAALAEGVTPEALANTAAEGIEAGKPKPFAWAIATARGRLAEGAKAITVTNGATHAHPVARRESLVERAARKAIDEERARQSIGQDHDRPVVPDDDDVRTPLVEHVR